MTLRKLHRLAVAIAAVGITAAAPAHALDPTATLDLNATDALASFAELSATGEQQEAFELANYLRYTCVDAIEVGGRTTPLTEIQAMIAANDLEALSVWADAAVVAGPASYVLQTAGCEGYDDLNTGSTSASTDPGTPPPPVP